MAKDILWSTYNEALGGWQKTSDLPGRTLYVQPDMDKMRWYWQVVWSEVKRKMDKKKGTIIEAKPRVTAWGTAPTRPEAKEAAVGRAKKARPRSKEEHGIEETMFDEQA